MKNLFLLFLFIPFILEAQKLDKPSFSTDLSVTPHFWQMDNFNRFLQENGFNGLRAFYAPFSIGFATDRPEKRFSFGIDAGSMSVRDNDDNRSTRATNFAGNVRFSYHLLNRNHFRLQPSIGLGYRLLMVEARSADISTNFSNITSTSNNGLSIRHESYGIEFGTNAFFWLNNDEEEFNKKLSYLGVGIGYLQPFSNTWRAYDVRLENAPHVNSGGFFVKITYGTFIFKN